MDKGNMKTYYWFSQLSVKQRVWLFATAALMPAIVVIGFFNASGCQIKEGSQLQR
jgi:hypothetical protein